MWHSTCDNNFHIKSKSRLDVRDKFYVTETLAETLAGRKKFLNFFWSPLESLLSRATSRATYKPQPNREAGLKFRVKWGLNRIGTCDSDRQWFVIMVTLTQMGPRRPVDGSSQLFYVLPRVARRHRVPTSPTRGRACVAGATRQPVSRDVRSWAQPLE